MKEIKVQTEYSHHGSFEKGLGVETIKKPWNKLYIDLGAKNKKRQDMNYFFILTTFYYLCPFFNLKFKSFKHFEFNLNYSFSLTFIFK